MKTESMKMKTGLIKTLCAAGIATAAFAPFANAEEITLTANDALTNSISMAIGQTSWNTAGHWSNNAAPSAGNTYIVPNGKMLRTPDLRDTANPDYKDPKFFAGDTLVLTNGALVNLKHMGNTFASANWVAYGCQINQGYAGLTLGVGGTMEVHGTDDSPTTFSGTGKDQGGSRATKVSAVLNGDATAVVKVAREKNTSGNYETGDRSGQNFTCTFSGDNATTYFGRFIAADDANAMTTPWVISFTSQAALGAPLADAAKVTLGNNFVLGGGDLALTNGYALALSGSAATITCSSLLVGRGGVSGTGSSALTLQSAATLADDATVSGLSKISVGSDGQLLGSPAASLCPVTVASTGVLAPGVGTTSPNCIGTLGVESLTIESGAVLKMSVAKIDGVVTSDFVRVTGDLTKPTDGQITLTLDTSYDKGFRGRSVRLFSAANLGTDGGLAASDFTWSAADATTAATLNEGVFKIRNENGVPTLVYRFAGILGLQIIIR